MATIPTPLADAVETKPVKTQAYVTDADGRRWLVFYEDGKERGRQAADPIPVQPEAPAFDPTAFLTPVKNMAALSPNAAVFEMYRAVQWLVKRELARPGSL